MTQYYSEKELPVMLTVQDIAAFLRVSKNTAYSFVSSGAIPVVKVGRQIRIHRDDVIRYVNARNS